LVAIAMTLTTDNCGCERLISLMSDLQRLIMQAPPDTAASRAKLNYMRTFADCRYAFKLVKKGAMKAPQEIPSLLKKGETGGFPSHLPRKRWDGKIFRPTYPGGADFWLITMIALGCGAARVYTRCGPRHYNRTSLK
jgi:hypothetical protein